MYSHAWSASRPRLLVAIVVLFVLDHTAYAIPSPDVMVNLFASTAQVMGLVSLLFGRWFLSSRARRGGASGKATFRVPFLVASVACVLSTAGWYLYHSQVRDENLARLQVNLTRNSSEEGRKIVDVSLKELSFSEQLDRSDGITTEDLARWVASGEEGQVLDVRETEEFEVGAIQGVRHVRFPDLLAVPEQYIDKGRDLVLLCFNGNRSSELAGHFEQAGYTCRFMIGGYEKWLAEDRPLLMTGEYERQDLREISDYPNKDLLLDTPDVVALVETSSPLFVDVRYPGDFAVSHLPGAVNIPMRKLTSADLDAALRALPQRPIIVPCYDKRSSFFGLVLGLRLHRMGYEFLGRYTTPEGYSVPGKDKQHVAAWKAAHAPKSLLAVVAERFEVCLTWFEGRLGSLALAILALVLVLRVAIAPLTLKAERDRRVQLRLAPELALLKQRLVEDPASHARALARRLREHGIRPLLTLMATLAQLVLFTIFFSVVQSVSAESTERFLWMDELGAPDALRVLPMGVALLVAGLLAIVTTRRVAVWLAPVAAVGMAFLVWDLSCAVNLYLALSLVLVIAQSVAVAAWIAWRSERDARRARRIATQHARSLVVPLAHAHLVPELGNKAARLGRLLADGLPVPNGFVVRATALEARTADGALSAGDRRTILAAFHALGSARVAVRSSGLNEDGAEKSFAGVFESVLDVTEHTLLEALETVLASMSSARVMAYTSAVSGAGQEAAQGSERETATIVIQAMVPAAFAGVLFTEHPGESGSAAIEMVAGLGDALVSGRAQPRTLKLGRWSGRVLGGGPAPIDVAPLFALGRRVEDLFGKPQDIEWAWIEGRFLVLQARDITRLASQGDSEKSVRERERSRLLDLARGAEPSEVVLAQNELSELLPNPTPYSLAFMESLWSHGGSTHRACQVLGIPYDVELDSAPFVVCAYGKLYVNRREEHRRMRRGPSSLAAFRLSRGADEMERSWREDFAPELERAARLREVMDLSQLTLDELVQMLAERRSDFVTRVYARAEEVNIAADFYHKAALRALARKGLDPVEHMASGPSTIVHESLELLARVGRGEARHAEFLALFGHRAPKDYEIADPRYHEIPGLVASLASRAASGRPHTRPATVKVESRVLNMALERAGRFQTLKEDAKHQALRDLAFLRRLVREMGARTGLGDLVFHLVPDEVERLGDAAFARAAATLAEARRDASDTLAFVDMGLEIRLADLEELDVEHRDLIPRRSSAAHLVGTRVSGQGNVIGRVRVLHVAEEIDSFRPGEILVARFTDPTWMCVFPLARGIVTEVGGWLSHAAIQAREYGITAVVGAAGALDQLTTGDLVRVGADGVIERLTERRTAARSARSLEVRIVSLGFRAARISDLSSTGALLTLSHGELSPGDDIEVEIEGELRAAHVARNGIPGIYGLEWTSRIDPITVAAARSRG